MPITLSFLISRPPQTQVITFGPLSLQQYGGRPFTNVATATSSLTVGFASNPAVCTVSGSTVTLMGLGTCLMIAMQPGSTGYYAAAPARDADIQGSKVTVAALTFLSSCKTREWF